jgi:hypothetical protein
MRINKTATIQRLTAEVANPNIESWQEVGTISGMLLPLSAEMNQLAQAQGIMGKAHNLYTEVGADIGETDRVVIDGIEYEVRGIKKYEGSRGVDHLEVLIEQRKT